MQDEARAERAHEAMGGLLRAASGLPKGDPERQWYVNAYRSIEGRYGSHPGRRHRLFRPVLALIASGLIGYGIGQVGHDHVLGADRISAASKSAQAERDQIREAVVELEGQQRLLFRLLQRRQRADSPRRPGSRAGE